MSIDRQNKNPSRLSRLPGVMRNGRKLFIIDKEIGKSSWEEWVEWIEAANDDLPEPESMAAVWDHLPELSPPLIGNVLRQGHKMLLAGPSKAGKSYALIELCISIAEGKEWFGFPCAQGRVMYVNLELDRASCLHRFKDVYTALHMQPKALKNIDIWNLRGNSVPMDKLAPKLIRRASKKDYIAIVIDPIYKIITGDENSADQMSYFCNQFDKVCTELGCAVIYCHHHSKGAQGGKRSMDRASGSGVFARDPDALLDLIELEVPEEVSRQQTERAVCNVCRKWLVRFNIDLKEYSQDDLLVTDRIVDICRDRLPETTLDRLREEISQVRQKYKVRTAWRIEGTLREFPRFDPSNLWFDYPVHVADADDVLKDISTEEKPPWQKGTERIKKNARERKKERKKALESALEESNFGDAPTVEDVANYLGISQRTARDRIKEHGGYDIENGTVLKKSECGET